jgi:uncharacterized membrane protein YfcA
LEEDLSIFFGVLVILIAGFFQGLTSFGFALISMPFLIKIIPIKEAVPIVVILSLLTNFIVMANCYKQIKIRKIWILILASIIWAPLGTYSLVYLNSTILKIFTAVFIIVFALILIAGKSFTIRNERVGYMITGSLSGFLNGSISMSGPPVALFLSNQGADKNEFRANITIYAIILNVITIIMYFYNGLITNDIIRNIIWLIPAMIIGVIVGILFSKKLNDKLFKKIALVLIIVSGLWTLVNAIISIRI